MAVNLQKIAYGESDWDRIVNSNFEAVNQDTGWIPLTLVAPASLNASTATAPAIRLVNGRVQLIGNVKVTDSNVTDIPNGLRIATFSDEFDPSMGWVFGTTPLVPTGGELTLHISAGGIFLHDSFSGVRIIDLGTISYLGK